jgi:hypothetical protein
VVLVTASTLIAEGPRALPAGGVDIKLAGDHIDFLAGDRLVARYHTGRDAAKPYFWPIQGPSDIPVTRGWPMEPALPGGSSDHPHQKSFWFGHGDVVPEGIELKQKVKGVRGVDFWSEGKGHGRIVCTRIGPPKIEGRRAVVATHNEWSTADGVKILDEDREISLENFGDARLLVLAIDLEASVVPVVFGDTKEGALGIRITDRIRGSQGGRIENAQGKVGEFACWGRRSGWCDCSGTIAGTTLGLAIFDDPGNSPPACWHCRNYGLMAANPFGRVRSGFPDVAGKRELVRLAKGEHLKLRYGLLIHPGDAKSGRVAEWFEKFVINHKGTKSTKETQRKDR